MSSEPISEWFGVKLDSLSGRVKELWLDNNNLQGTIPSDIGLLTELEYIGFEGNRGLTGSLPIAFGNLGRLDQMRLRGTGIEASQAVNLATRAEIRTLLVGIDGDIGARDRPILARLFSVWGGLSWRDRSGWCSSRPLSEWYGVSTNSKGRVVSLYLGQNELTGLIDGGGALGGLGRLTRLSLFGNFFENKVPESLAQLTALTYLDLEESGLLGVPPETPLECKSAADLCALFKHFGILRAYKEALAAEQKLAAERKVRAEKAAANLSLGMAGGPPSGSRAGPSSSAAAMQQQQESAEQLLSKEHSALLTLGAARHKWADATGWGTAAVSEEWYGVAVDDKTGRLTRLALEGNRLAGGLSELASGLFGACSRLLVLDLRCNALRGPIPPSISLLASVKQLYLSLNHLSGELPAELGRLVGLEKLALNGNRLEGRVPPALGALTRLAYLDLSLNRLAVPDGAVLECASVERVAVLFELLAEAARREAQAQPAPARGAAQRGGEAESALPAISTGRTRRNSQAATSARTPMTDSPKQTPAGTPLPSSRSNKTRTPQAPT